MSEATAGGKARPRKTPTGSKAAAATKGTNPEIKTLDDLAELDPDALMDLYRAATTPRLKDLDGKLVGRLLVILKAQEPHIARLLHDFARSGVFPWQGKTFESEDAGHGHGINRVLHERFNWFPFDTSIARSRAGDFDAVELNYDRPGNPPLVRSIKDEVREVAPGLWLGLAYLDTKSGPKLGCYFAVAKQQG
jgi:hypothetical protein